MPFLDNFAKFLNVTGPQYGHIAWFLAGVDWPNDLARDEFADWLRSPQQPAQPPVSQ